LEGFSKQEPELDNYRQLRPANYSQGDIVSGLTVKDVPLPNELTENGKQKLPVAFKDDFVVILLEYPKDIQIGDTLDVVLTKVTRSHSKKIMGFGAVR